MAFWLFATQHCGLEAAGLFAGHDDLMEGRSCCTTAGGCENDGCATVEDGAYRPDQGSLVVPAPSLTAVGWLISCDVALPKKTQSERPSRSEPFERPLDWVTTWQFVQRAALSPRAPSLG